MLAVQRRREHIKDRTKIGKNQGHAVHGSIRQRIHCGLRVGLPAPRRCAPVGSGKGRGLPDPICSAARLHAPVVIVPVAAAAGAHRAGGER